MARLIEDYCLELWEQGMTKDQTYWILFKKYINEFTDREIWQVVNLCYGDKEYKS